jgi:hypothetical protein
LSVYKSLGLIDPKASREQLEKNNFKAELPNHYIDIDDIGINIPIFPKNLNRSLRGFKNFLTLINGQKVEVIKFNDRLKLADILKSANDLANHSAYAKTIGMAGKKFRLIKLNAYKEIITELEKGNVVRVFVSRYGGHYVTLTNVERDRFGDILQFYADDNFRGKNVSYNLSEILISSGDPERQAFSIEPILFNNVRN